MPNETQHYKILVTPAQRLQLFTLAYAKGQEIKDPETGKRFRRFLRGFAILPIRATVDKFQGALKSSLASSNTPAVFSVTVENIEYATQLQSVARNTVQESILGDLWDAMEATTKEGFKDAEGPAYEAATEDWTPPENPITLEMLLDTVEDCLPTVVDESLRVSAQEIIDRGRHQMAALQSENRSKK